MWKIPSFEARSTQSGKTDVDLIGVYQDSGKKPLAPKGKYTALAKRLGTFKAKLAQTQFVRFGGKRGAESVLFMGLGPAADLTTEKLRQVAGTTWAKLTAERAKSATVDFDGFLGAKGLAADLTPRLMARAFAEGLALSAYKFDKYKSSAKEEGADYVGPPRVSFVSRDKTLADELKAEVARAMATAEAMRVTRDWSNEPSNEGTPEFYAAEAKKLGSAHGLKVKVLTERDCEREKMGLFLAVGQGAERESRLVVVEYTPKGGKSGRSSRSSRSRKTLALVGKGVTFDSGGISIKPSSRMEEMKHDMTGAATVMGAVLLAAKLKVPNRVIGIMAFVENMPDGAAVQPGNIVRARNGKTVEINNTDAEGRLVLADALDYAHDFKPDAILNIATLTGAVGVALGRFCCGAMGNNGEFMKTVRRMGDLNGERVWELPLFDEYLEDMKGETADLRNVGNDGSGGTIRGGIFLKQFIRKGMPWVHLDIAATSWGGGYFSYYPKKGANGAHVRTLAQLAEEL